MRNYTLSQATNETEMGVFGTKKNRQSFKYCTLCEGELGK
jgi:hypothetical protein